MSPKWIAGASATMVGSMPHQDRPRVIDLIFRELADIPVWPQLPMFAAEQMMFQYLEGLPGLRQSGERIFFDTGAPEFDDELYAFYEEFLGLESDPQGIETSRFRMGPETGRTFYEFLERLVVAAPCARAVKGQVVGPFTLLSGLKDGRDRALLYDERFQEVVPKHLAMKARWQIRRLKQAGRPVILFLDEPALAGFGSSAFISVSRELIGQLLREVVDAVHQEGALAGIHVCANTDWLLAFDASVDVINLDAYNYIDKFLLYGEAFSHFMGKGGIMAWGMVPTSAPDLIGRVNARELADRWLQAVEPLAAPERPLKTLIQQSLFTPSCGCGSLSEASAERVMSVTAELSRLLKDRL